MTPGTNNESTGFDEPWSPCYGIDLRSGWNLIAYACPNSQSTYEAFAELIETDSLVAATGYEDGALFFDPDLPHFLNSLTIMKPGMGYWVKINRTDIPASCDDYTGASWDQVIEFCNDESNCTSPICGNNLSPPSEWIPEETTVGCENYAPVNWNMSCTDPNIPFPCCTGLGEGACPTPASGNEYGIPAEIACGRNEETCEDSAYCDAGPGAFTSGQCEPGPDTDLEMFYQHDCDQGIPSSLCLHEYCGIGIWTQSVCNGMEGLFLPPEDVCNWDIFFCMDHIYTNYHYYGMCGPIGSPSPVWFTETTGGECVLSGEFQTLFNQQPELFNQDICLYSEEFCTGCEGSWTPSTTLGVPCFTFPDPNNPGSPCGFVGGSGGPGETEFTPVFVHGDSDHVPSSIVNYIAFTLPNQQYINNVFPTSWLDVSRSGPGEFTEQDVIYTDFWDWTGEYNHYNIDFSYYKDGEWQPNIVLKPGRGYVLKTSQDGWINWRING